MESTIIESAQQRLLFWNEFVHAVKLKTEGLEKRFTKSTDERIVGWYAVEEPNQMHAYYQCEIAVTRYSTELSSESCQRYLYYTPGAEVITMCARGQGDILIHVNTATQGTLADVNGSFMSATQLANSVVDAMYERVKFPE